MRVKIEAAAVTLNALAFTTKRGPMNCRHLRLCILLVLGLSLIEGRPLAAAPRGLSSKPDKSSSPARPDNAWPQLTDDEQEKAVEEMKQVAADVAKQLKHDLLLHETKYFLFYSDLRPVEAGNWAGLLDRMYARLAELFAVPKGQNLWRGKGLIFVFSRAEDYRRFEREIAHTDAGGTAGMCHTASTGVVMIAFYRQPQELTFAHVLVHESVHGFLHRYRSPNRIPSWANEGLAETIATELVPERGRRELVKTSAREQLQEHGSALGNFFESQHIEGWQYPVAESLCSFMIMANRTNYVDFINGIKDGLTWEQSLDERYKAPLDRLVPVFGSWLGVKGLKI